MYYNEPGAEYKDKRESGGKTVTVVIITVVATLAVAASLFGVFLWGQNVAKTTSSSSGVSLSLSKNSSSSGSVSGGVSISSSSVSSASSTSSNSKLTRFNDPTVTQFSLSYDEREWTLVNSKLLPSDQNNTTVITNKSTGSKLSINIIKLEGVGFGSGQCLGSDQIVNLNDIWYRIRFDDGTRAYTQKSQVNFDKPSGLSGGVDGECPKDKNLASGYPFSIIDSNGGKYRLSIKADIVGDNRAIGDDIIKTIKY